LKNKPVLRDFPDNSENKVMRYRTATTDDIPRLFALYADVASVEGGIARLEYEITEAYIEQIVRRSIDTGLIIVGEHPDDPDQLVAGIHAYKAGPAVIGHVLGDMTIGVHPDFQGKKIGRTILTIFLEEIGKNRPDIGKVELITRESNTRAITLYQSMGFKIEGRLEMRIRTTDRQYEADIPMGWQNPNYEF
jgi:ribosomal protein S18 acetylase RimI-like enzyme